MPHDLTAGYQQLTRVVREVQPRAAVQVASSARDLDDCRQLLAALGLDTTDVVAGAALLKLAHRTA